MLIPEILNNSYAEYPKSKEFDWLRIINPKKPNEFFIEQNLTFSTKEEYWTWVLNWKKTLAAIVDQQKKLKKEIRQPHIITEHRNPSGWTYKSSSASGAQSTIQFNKHLISNLLYLRARGKLKYKTSIRNKEVVS